MFLTQICSYPSTDSQCLKVCVQIYCAIQSPFPSPSLLISYYVHTSHLSHRATSQILNCSYWFTFFGFSYTLPSVQSALPLAPYEFAVLQNSTESVYHLWSFSLSTPQGELVTHSLCSNVPHRCLAHTNDSTLWHTVNCVFISIRLWTPLVKNPLCFITVEIVLSTALALRYINHISIKLFKNFFKVT